MNLSPCEKTRFSNASVALLKTASAFILIIARWTGTMTRQTWVMQTMTSSVVMEGTWTHCQHKCKMQEYDSTCSKQSTACCRLEHCWLDLCMHPSRSSKCMEHTHPWAKCEVVFRTCFQQSNCHNWCNAETFVEWLLTTGRKTHLN
eukprot:3253378-Amphidinium_carterae.1